VVETVGSLTHARRKTGTPCDTRDACPVLLRPSRLSRVSRGLMGFIAPAFWCKHGLSIRPARIASPTDTYRKCGHAQNSAITAWWLPQNRRITGSGHVETTGKQRIGDTWNCTITAPTKPASRQMTGNRPPIWRLVPCLSTSPNTGAIVMTRRYDFPLAG
jgi:hypothetical protein